MSLKNLSVKNKIPNILKKKLTNRKVIQVYKRFEKSLNINEKFAVAVSGGPDSLALAFLAKIFASRKGLVSKFFIVDHKLRLDSTKEAESVKKALKKISIDAEILTWKGKKPSKNIQSLARKKRYELIFSKCDKYKIYNVLIGHHQDDLIENFFIRLLRGSGLKGLSSLNEKTQISKINLLRPLLNEKKEDLALISKYIYGFYIKDPSNFDEKYQRIKVRKLINELKINGLDKKKFNKTIENLNYSNSVVDFYVRENIKKNSYTQINNQKLILSNNFFKQPYEIIFRSLSESIRHVGKKYYPVRGKKIDRIIHLIGSKTSFKVTLGGCIIKKVNGTVILSKE